MGPGRTGLLHFLGGAPRESPKFEILGLNVGHLTANYLEEVSCSVTCQLQLNISSAR